MGTDEYGRREWEEEECPELVSGEDGLIHLGHLDPGKYELVQTEAPEGCVTLDQPIEITVDKKGVSYVQARNSRSLSGDGVHRTVEETPARLHARDDAGRAVAYTLDVINDNNYSLPGIGGPGTTWMYLLGAAIIALSLTLYGGYRLGRRFGFAR